MDENTKSTVDPVWCVVANIVNDRSFGPGGIEKQQGTKHFPPGTKLYLVDFFWGTGAERVIVVGRHRGSHRYVTMVVSSEWLANWRVELVYSPYVIRQFSRASATYGYDESGQYTARSIWDGSPESKEEAERIVTRFGVKTQPFVTRPPHSTEQSNKSPDKPTAPD